MNKNVVFGAIAVAALGAGGFGVYKSNLFDSKLVKVCEAELKSRLRSPAGYQRISVREETKNVSVIEWVGMKKLQRIEGSDDLWITAAELNKAGISPVVYYAYITYDAPNAYNALIRAVATCEHPSEKGERGNINMFTVSVDGETSLNHLDGLIDAAGTRIK